MSIKSNDKALERKSTKVINPVAATRKIDLGYLDGREYTDGISEHYLDKQRKMLARKHESLMNV